MTVNHLGRSRASCITALETYQVSLRRLAEHRGVRGDLAEALDARVALNALIMDVTVDVLARERSAGRERMTLVELAHLTPALKRLSAQLGTLPGHSPSAAWIATLHSASESLEREIAVLRSLNG